METITKTNVAHPFEKSLGAGPYRFVGMFHISLAAGAMGRPYYDASLVHKNFVRGAGTCAHCGHAILNVCQVMIGNGEVYGIGTDCIAKVSMPVIELTKVQKAVKAHEKALRDARKKRKGDAARIELGTLIAEKADLMATIPNGRQTLLSYAQWCHANSNSGGIVIVLKHVKACIQKAGVQ